jgi:negative regulator of sigma E activity
MKLVRIAPVLGLLSVACFAGAQYNRERGLPVTEAQRAPIQALFRSMEDSRRKNVEAIVMRTSYNGKASSQCKFEQTSRGITKFTILAPLCDQGTIMFDDGRNMKNIIPDEKKMFVYDSPRHNAQMAIRQALAEQNYKFSAANGEKVAGRATVVIVAVPKSSLMPSRRYSVDVANTYLLRVETEHRGDRKVLMDTIAINYPRTLSIADPEREHFSQYRRVEIETPVTVPDVSKITEMVGFRPAIPADLPFGFAMIDKQVDQNRDSVAFRISDGLAHATIYQSRSKPDKKGSAPGSRREVRGFEFKLIGDLPDPVISRLLDIFAREALKGLNPLAETPQGLSLLDDLQQDEEAVLLITVIIDAA